MDGVHHEEEGGKKKKEEEKELTPSFKSSAENYIDAVDHKNVTKTDELLPADSAAGSDPSALEAQKETVTQATEAPEYSAFSQKQKWFIVAMASMAAFVSPLSGQIYYPVMPALVKNYHLTTALVNLTITTYMILQGLAPSFMGTFADTGGRRLAYIIAFAIYTAANIGLALQNSYAALLVLRCIQSAGSSGTVSFGYGTIADIATPAERGTYIGPMASGIMVAPALGPVIGGLLAKFLGWRSVFWFLVILSGGYLVLFAFAMPETARKIVGNGSVPPKEWWRMSGYQYLTARRQLRKMPEAERRAAEEKLKSLNEANKSNKLRFPNPLKSFVILLEKDAAIIIFYVGLAMFSNIALLTSTPNLFGKLYRFNELQIGLCFLPLGAGACVAAVVNGRVLDWNYRRVARKLGLPADRKKGDDLRNFPIEEARLQVFFPVMVLGVLTFIPYGWVLQQHAPLVAPLILQFIIGFCFIASLNTLNTLLVDLFSDRPATASAACNLFRCWLGAVGAAVIDFMLNGMGWGWCFAFLGLVMAAALGLVWIEMLHGRKWREARLAKLDRKKADKAERERQMEEADLQLASKADGSEDKEKASV